MTKRKIAYHPLIARGRGSCSGCNYSLAVIGEKIVSLGPVLRVRSVRHARRHAEGTAALLC